jgi:membrane associated rhomboid family serine protease
MGSNDRDYMRRDSGWRGGSAAFWFGPERIVWVFIAISTILFLFPGVDRWATFTSNGLGRWELWRFISYQFVHGGLLHVGLNMVGLYFVGRTVVSILGPTQFALIYLAGGVCGALFEWLLQSAVGRPCAIVGASASISALMFVFVTIEPRMMVRLFPFPFSFTLVRLAWGFAIINGLLGLSSLASPASAGSTAYLAHLGGALYGILHGKYFRQRITLPVIRFVRSSKRPKPAPGQTRKSTATAPYRSRPGQPNVIDAEFSKPTADYNEVLDKINREGIGSLTPAERRILERASENLGRRND